MKTASNGGLGFESRIRLDGLRKDAESLKNELRSASVSGTESMNALSKGAASAVEGMARRVSSSIKETEGEINSLSRKIIQQASLIKDIERDVATRKDVYNRSFGMNKTAAFGEYQAAKKALDEEKSALSGLNTERATARVRLTEMKQELRGYNAQLTQGNSLKRDMLGLLGKIGGVYALKRLGQEIIDVRGEMQMLSISFTTLLNSKEKADKLMGQLTQSVLTTPLQLTELAQGAKQLLAFGFQAEQVNDTLLKLGNIAKGLNIPLSDMVYLYGTTMTEGRLFARDLRQFTTRGIPLADELAKQFGVTKERVSELVSAGKVGFPQVEKALNSMTSEGGRFFNLMQEQVKSIPGQLSNLKDSLTMQFNDIGKSLEGAISGGITATKFLVDNLDVLGKMLVSLVATYGAYKTAIMLASIAQSAYGIKTLVLRNYLLLAQKAQAFLNATMLANPYVAATVAIFALVGIMWSLSDSTSAAEKAQKSLNETLEKAKNKKEEMTADAQKLVSIIRNETSSIYEQIKAWNELIKKYEFFSKYSMDDIKNMSEKDRNKLLAEFGVRTEKGIAGSDYEAELKNIERLEKRINNLRESAYKKGELPSGIGVLEKQLEAAKTKAEGLKGTIDEIANNEKQASILALPVADQLKYYNDEISKLIQSKKGLTGTIGDIATGMINTQIDTYQKKIDELKKNEVIKNESHWEKIKKDAEEALSGIDREIFKQLEKGNRKGVSAGILDIYDTNTKLKKQAEGMLDEKKSNTDPLKAQEELNQRQLTLLRSLERAKLDIMQEGRDKEIEEIRLTAQQKLDEIDKQEKELAKAYKAAKKAMPDADREKFTQQRGIVVSSAKTATDAVDIKYYNEIKEKERELSQVFLSENQKREQAIKDRYDAERKWANEMFGSGGMTQEQYNSFINLIDSAETEEIFADFRDKYKTAVEEIAEIERQALADKAKANTDAQRDLVEQWRKIQIENVQKSILDKNGLGGLLSGDMSDFILQEVKKGLPLFHSIAEASASQLLKAKEAIKGIKLPEKLLNELKEAGIDIAKLVELLEKAKDASTEQVDVELFEKLDKIVDKLAASLGKLGNSLEGLGGTAGEIGGAMSGLASSVGDVMAVFKKGADNTDRISAGINGLMNLASMVVNQIKANREEQERWTAAIAESVHQASLLRIEALNYKESNIFGIENPYARAIAGARQYTQSMSELNAAALKLNDGQIQTGTKKAVSGKNVMSGVGSGAALGAAIGGIAGAGVFSLPAAAIGAAIGAVVGGIVGLLSTKTVKVFESLKQKYGEIYNKDTFELNPKILADYSKLDEATKKLVDNWKEIKEKAKEAQEQMRQNFKDIAGDIGTKLSDSLENAFRDGKIFNAIDDFKGYMTKTIEDIISQLIFSAHFEAMFKELQQKFEDSFGESGDGTIIDDLIWFTQKYKEGLEDYNRDMQIAKDQLVKEGFDIFGSLERQGAKKGIANASQDSIDDLMGTAVNIQSHTYSLMNDFKTLLADTNALVRHTMNIDNNTKRLENIEQHMSDVKKGIDTINLKGVQLK